MQSIESLAQRIGELERCSGQDRHADTIVPERLHVARGPGDSIELFIEGSRESFGVTAIGRSLEWGRYHDTSASRDLDALVVRTSAGDGTLRLMAHLAYEAARTLAESPGLANSKLVENLTPFIALIIQRALLSTEQQMGLIAELMLLLELINFSDRHEPQLQKLLVLNAWNGWDSASRDFSGGGVAVETKSTARDSRRHTVRPMYQLLPDPSLPGEHVYLYSVGLRPDRSQSFRLLTIFDRVAERLGPEEFEVFTRQLGRYGGLGFDSNLRTHYQLETGFVVSQAPALYRVDNLPDILRPESFVGGQAPSRVHRVGYEISLEGLPQVAQSERGTVFERLLAHQ